MIKLIHADNFFLPEDVNKLYNVAASLPFVEKEYGLEIDNFNLVPTDIESTFSKVLGQRVTVDHDRSGVFRRPMDCVIHFESFETRNEWCFIVALQNTTFNLYHHITGAKSALDGYQWNYRNLFEWEYETNILLKPNQGVFFRPWLFHSIENGIVQYYRLLTHEG